MENEIKVREAEFGETGWATVSGGKIILDNSFERYSINTELVLKKDGYTIDNLATDKLIFKKSLAELNNEIAEREQKKQLFLKESAKYIGKHVSTSKGKGIINEAIARRKLLKVYFESGETSLWSLNVAKEKVENVN